MKSFEKIIPDTSIIIEGILSEKLGTEWKAETVIIHQAVLSELEHQANQGRSIGYLGLDEIKLLREKADKGGFVLDFKGKKPNITEIKYASLGEIDSSIRELAYDENATLITGDKIQHRVAEARGVKVEYLKPRETGGKTLKIESFFDPTTMSVHLKEGVLPFAKKGFPGNWQFAQLADKIIDQDTVQEIAREIIEEAKKRKDSYIEIERTGSTIVQLGTFRIVMTRPPLADGWEITAVRPVKKLTLEEYNLSEKLIERIEKQAEGILVAGAPGMGKTTFAAAVAVFYAEKGKIVKTIEAPRDLVLPDSVTQYAISHGDPQEIHDILLLTRPDYTLFDEMRNTKDFLLFADLRLAGIGLAGVIHATNPIDAIQRFVGRIELGVIPHVIDTVIFIKNGQVAKVLSLEMTVKVPSGMTEADLARPVVVVTDFETKKMEYEIYSYGEETVVVPVTEERQYDPTKLLAARQIEQEMKNYVGKAKVKVLANNKAEVYIPTEDIPRIIGKQGKNIEKIEKQLGFNIDIKELDEFKSPQSSEEKQGITYKVEETKNAIILRIADEYAGTPAEVYVDGHFLFTSTVSKKGDIKIHKKSKLGQTLVDDLRNQRKLEIRA
ncbi:Flp pilus assembly complex ATPase component TadA [Candidatus Woesearchaeota archaeon]|nr:Flp pilus assembly complex ATPase component TadA [Candidatus Woesearchaeota archaeon]